MATPRLGDLLGARAREDGDRPAFVVEGADGLSYRAWDRRSNALARGLLERGLRPAAPVVLWFERPEWADYAVAYAGVAKAGGVAVPLAGHLSELELARVVTRCQAAAVVRGGSRGPAPGSTERMEWTAEAAQLESGQDDGAPPPTDLPGGPTEIAVRCRPLERLQATPLSSAEILAGLPGDRTGSLLHAFSVGTDGARRALWLATLPGAGPVVILPAFDPEPLGRLTALHGVEAWDLDPAAALWVLESGALDGHAVASITRVLLSGGRPRASLASRLATALPHASVVTLLRGDGSGPPLEVVHDRSRPGSVGRPLEPDRVLVVGKDGEPVAEGRVGRLSVDDQPTGDLAYLDDGRLYTPATDDVVVHTARGPVSAAEVAQALRDHPAVADAAVLGVGEGGGTDQVVAAVALRAPAEPDELKHEVRRRLGPARAPDVVTLVERVPRNPSGVLLGRRLRALVGVAGEGDEPDGPAAAPTEVEEAIVSAWERVLGGGGREVAAATDFFELGGDPAAAARMLSLVEDSLDVGLELRPFLAEPTLAGLSAAVREAQASRPASRLPAVPLAASQEGMVWHEQFAPGSQNLPPLARRYRGPLDVAVLQRALSEIVRRHEPLRTTFEMRGGRPVQVVAGPAPVPLPLRDVSGLDPAAQEAAVARVLAGAARPFHLHEGPLFEALVVRLAGDDHVVVFRVHHSVYDDWSVSVFRRELSALYTAFAEPDAPLPPEPALGFAEFSRRQGRRLAGPAGAAELRWWRRELDGAPWCLQLPVDDPARPEGSPQHSAAPVGIDLPAELANRLRALARRERSTVFQVVLAGFQVLLRRYTGLADLLLSSVVANRNRTELEGMIGCFTKKVLLRHTVEGDPPFVELLAGTRRVLLGALSHQDLPFETVLQEVLGGPAAAHGLVPYSVVMLQGVTPQADEVVLHGLTSTGLETSSTARREHFVAASAEGRGTRTAASGERPPWGAGLYSGTFLILSVVEPGDGLSLVARGAFWEPAVERVLADLEAVLGDAVTHPGRRLSELAPPAGDRSPVGGTGAGDERGDACLGALLEAQAEREPSRAAVRSASETLTFAELDARTAKLAAGLRALGVRRGSRVGVCLPASVDAVVAAVGAWKAGAAWAGLDTEGTDEHLVAAAGKLSLELVLAGPERRRGAFERHVRLVTPEAVLGAAADALDGGETPRPDDAAVVVARSETASEPVVLSHRSLAALRRRVGRDTRGGAGGPPSGLAVGLSARASDDAFVRQLVVLLDGRTLHVAAPQALVTLVAQGTLDVVDVDAHRLGSLDAAGLGDALAAARERRREPVLVVGLRAAPPAELVGTLGRLSGGSARLVFGPPECAFAATTGPVPDAGTRITVGRPMAGVTARVLDEKGTPAPRQAVGELHLDAPGCRPHPTGRLARVLPDGSIELLGRLADSSHLGGFRVDRARIEAVLRQSPAVRDVRVAFEGDAVGGGRLVAHVVAEGDRSPTLDELRVLLWRELPGYAWAEALVLEASDSPPAAARLPEAAVLAALWADALGVADVGAEENYWQRFSFLEAVARAQEAGIPIAGGQVARNRTIATLAADMAATRQRRSAT